MEDNADSKKRRVRGKESEGRTRKGMDRGRMVDMG